MLESPGMAPEDIILSLPRYVRKNDWQEGSRELCRTDKSKQKASPAEARIVSFGKLEYEKTAHQLTVSDPKLRLGDVKLHACWE